MRRFTPSRHPWNRLSLALVALALVLVPALGQARNVSIPAAQATPRGCSSDSTLASPIAATPESGIAPGCSPLATPTAAAVTLELVDIAYQPATLTIPANQAVTIHLIGKGIAAHNVNIDELQIHTDAVTYGKSLEIVVTAAPGVYSFYCSFPGHKQAGMVGRLIVK